MRGQRTVKTYRGWSRTNCARERAISDRVAGLGIHIWN
jgi:hypothetical protein